LGKWKTAFGKKCANVSLKFGGLSLGEIKQQFFCGDFWLGEKSLVKSTPGVKISCHFWSLCPDCYGTL